MGFSLFAAIFLALGAAGLVLGLPRLVGRRAPGWAAPMAAAIAMFGFSVWSEYSWFGRTASALPPGVEVVGTHESSSPLQPWTYLVPATDGFVALDLVTARPSEAAFEVLAANVLVFGRYQPTRLLPHLLDCEEWRRAVVTEATPRGENGLPVEAEWTRPAPEDPLLSRACGRTG